MFKTVFFVYMTRSIKCYAKFQKVTIRCKYLFFRSLINDFQFFYQLNVLTCGFKDFLDGVRMIKHHLRVEGTKPQDEDLWVLGRPFQKLVYNRLRIYLTRKLQKKKTMHMYITVLLEEHGHNVGQILHLQCFRNTFLLI